MTPEDILSYVETKQLRMAELEKELSDPSIYQNQQRMRSVSQEHRAVEELCGNFDRWRKMLEELAENRQIMSAGEEDPELRDLAAAEVADLEAKSAALEEELKLNLLPPDPNDGKNIIVELKPAAGGEESALFTGELARAYMKYAEGRHWKLEILDQGMSDLGGLKHITFSLAGDGVYSRLKYESGVHRVQRVPETESGGRVHTSTITVSVMPEAEEVEIDVKQEDLRFDVFRSSGPGGQCVNTTDSAVRVTHIPTGIAVASQQEKSQHQNKAIALRILYARLLEIKQNEENAKLAGEKRAQVGTGDRSERIRTYNFPQNRVTDHRFGVNAFDLPKIMEGDLDLLLDPIFSVVAAQRLETLISSK
ncbi:MAG: peptide chain release factor 1 [Victivallaceae bacterium]|nr:peptide chain release factor 1 [Victivallaceae bacterium]